MSMTAARSPRILTTAIAVMAWQAGARWLELEQPGALLASLGATLFAFSDGALAWNRFRRPFRPAQAIVLGTYFSAQWLIAAVVSVFVFTSDLPAHEIRPALLQITEREPGWFDVMWKVPMRGDMMLRLEPQLPESLRAVGQASERLIPGASVQNLTMKSDGSSIVGDTVNTTQRLEALGKQIDDGSEVTILITSATRAHLGAEFTVVSAGAFHVPGKEHPLQVFRLLPCVEPAGDR